MYIYLYIQHICCLYFQHSFSDSNFIMSFWTDSPCHYFDIHARRPGQLVAEISDLRPFLMTDKRAWVLGNSDFTKLLCWWLWEASIHHGNLFPGGFDFTSTTYHQNSGIFLVCLVGSSPINCFFRDPKVCGDQQSSCGRHGIYALPCTSWLCFLAARKHDTNR